MNRSIIAGLLVVVLNSSLARAQCPTETFPPVSPHPANAAYPDPELDVRCDPTTLIVESNGIPSHEFVQITPNDLEAQNHRWRLPLYPVLPANWTSIPLLGVAGIAINGLPLFGPNEAAVPNPHGDPVYNGIMDDHYGHTAMRGLYHYHALLVASLTSPDVPGEPSPIIGYANDGFPIYGPWGCLDADCNELIRFESSWEQTGDPSTYAWDNNEYVEKPEVQYLDRCNGRIGPDGSYRYHATDTFPYILGCYGGLDVLKELVVAAPPPVPDGRTDREAIKPSRVTADGSELAVSWDDSCPPVRTKLIYGSLENVATLAPDGAVCEVGQPVDWTGVPTGSQWFLMVSDDGDATEGSWGAGSGGERQATLASELCGSSLKDLTGVCGN